MRTYKKQAVSDDRITRYGVGRAAFDAVPDVIQESDLDVWACVLGITWGTLTFVFYKEQQETGLN